MCKSINEIKDRITQLRAEIIMGKYYDGWTLKGMIKELKYLEVELYKKNEK